jgi:hypothetical protein
MTSDLNQLAAEWQSARRLHPLYAAMAREFVIDVPHCADLEAELEAPPQESVEQARQWLLDVDSHVQVYQLRQFLQTTSLISEEVLLNLLHHHLGKSQRTESDRDKIDFLLVQYFSLSAPTGTQEADVDNPYVAQVLEPVLGKVNLTQPDWLKPLDACINDANACKNLNELLTKAIVEKGRKLKTSVGEKYYLPAAMVAFTRFSFLMRRVFFRLMHQDLNAILDGLRELEQRGVRTLDCRRAQFSAGEPIDRLRMICQSWKVMFHAEYSSGQPLRMLVDLRGVVTRALETSKASAPAAHAAGAGAAAGAAEFQVAGDTPDWSEQSGSRGTPKS